jgi:RimJ/RimL family protein N-acetyltransferase
MKWIMCGGVNVDGMVARWAADRMGLKGELWAKYTTMSLWDDAVIQAAVIYEGYSPKNICMHVAAIDGKAWLNRAFLKAAFEYPFNQLKVERVTGLVPDSNEAAKRFDEHLGFKREGIMRGASDDGSDMIVYGMLRSECRHLEKSLGQK